MLLNEIHKEIEVYNMLFDFMHIENLGAGALKLDSKQYDACNTCPQKKAWRGGMEGSEAGTSHVVIQKRAIK